MIGLDHIRRFLCDECKQFLAHPAQDDTESLIAVLCGLRDRRSYPFVPTPNLGTFTMILSDEEALELKAWVVKKLEDM